MHNQTVSDIYATNEAIHEKLKQTMANLTDGQAEFLPENEKWTITQIVEHLSIVDEGISRISAKLLKKAQTANNQSSGTSILSENFTAKAVEMRDKKLEAPEQVHPTGNQTIEQSLARMDESRRKLEELRPLFESVDCADYKFPHPYLGELTAAEWLALAGGHEARHLHQIKKLMRQFKAA